MPAPSFVAGKVWTAIDSGPALTLQVGPSTLAEVSNGALVALLGARDETPVSPSAVIYRSAADGGATFTQPYTRIGGVISGAGTAGATVVDLWYLPNPDTAAPGETVAMLDSTWNQIFGIVAQFRDVDQTAPIGDTDSEAVFSNSATSNHTTQRNDSLLIAGVAHRHGDTVAFAYDANSAGIAVADLGPSVTLDPCSAMFCQPAPTIGGYSLTATALDAAGNPSPLQRLAMFSFELFGAAGGADATAAPSGISVTGAVGPVRVDLDATAVLTGVSGAGQAGAVTAGTAASTIVVPTGGSIAGMIGSIGVALDATVAPAGGFGVVTAGRAVIFQWTKVPDASEVWEERGPSSDPWIERPAAPGSWT